MSRFIDIHVLQSIPANNLNRDAANQPKQVIYGGTLRSRVSSQAWKRAIRLEFRKNTDEFMQSERSKHMPTILAKEIMTQSPDTDLKSATKQAIKILKLGGVGVTKDKNSDEQITKALFMLSAGQIRNIVKFATEHDLDKLTTTEKKELKELFKTNNSLDLALFGRMVAEDADLNVDAACQVAHAFSVNSIEPEFDYFTAVDDYNNEKKVTGAAMIDSNGFNSSTLYRYANINVTELKHNLQDDNLVKKGVTEFLKDFVLSMPSGKQNSYANHTLPAYVMITVRDDQPVNLASAFETAINSSTGYLQKSVSALESEFKADQKFVAKPIYTGVVTTKKTELNSIDNLSDLIAEAVKNTK